MLCAGDNGRLGRFVDHHGCYALHMIPDHLAVGRWDGFLVDLGEGVTHKL